MNIKGINVNEKHINERLARSTSNNTEHIRNQIEKVINLLSSKRSILTSNTEWEVNTSSFKAVGDGTNWRTILNKDSHNSRSVLYKWNV
jgi:hypothetical protein